LAGSALSAPTACISEPAHQILKELAKQIGQRPMLGALGGHTVKMKAGRGSFKVRGAAP